MPIYTLKNNDTNEIFEKVMKIAEYEDYLIENPNIERYFDTAPLFGDPTRISGTAASKGDPTFQREIIGRMKATIPGNTLNDRKYQIPREW